LDATTGEQLWRSYVIPGPGEPGHETWADDHDAWKTGGAGLWTTGSYDPGQRVTIWGTGQPVPMHDPEYRPGDNLYSNSAIAWDIDTGKMKWFFQYTPNESWDYDEQGVHMLIDAPFNGTNRKMVTHFGRNGYYYYLDRTNGSFIHATQFVDKITWTAGLDPKTGKPVEYDPKLQLQAYMPATRMFRADTAAKVACPSHSGGLRWQPPAYNPDKRIAYSGGHDGCQRSKIVATTRLPDGGIDEHGRRSVRDNLDDHGQITAQDVTTGTMIARIRQPYPNLSGVLATAGGLIFTGNGDGSVAAYNDDTLEELWRFETGIGIKSPVFSYSYGGKQFIAIAAGAQQANFPEIGERGWGAMLFVFSL
jgi:alcohol dehydrogenase (cytochrome c)